MCTPTVKEDNWMAPPFLRRRAKFKHTYSTLLLLPGSAPSADTMASANSKEVSD